MSYHALARKYRPRTFAEMVGQEHVVRTLRAAVRKDKLAHAYLFAGPRGCGKTTVARLLAKALNCPQRRDDDPCGECEVCRAIAAGTWLDVLEIDAASHTGVDNIRDLRDMAQYQPTQGSNRVFIIDEVHMLSKGAFNALLKILEEPPARVFFFFATTEPNRIPRTILSRCQRFDFRLLSREELSARLADILRQEQVTLEEGALRLVVNQAEGSMRDALSILDQVVAAAAEGVPVTEQDVSELFGLVRGEVFTALNEALLSHDPAAALRLTGEVLAAGRSVDDFSRGLLQNLRHLLLLRADPALAEGIGLPADQVATLREQAARWSLPDLLAMLERTALARERMARSPQPRILLEALVVELALLESRVLLSDLVRRLEQLTGAPLVPRGAAPAGGTRPAAAGGSASRPTATPENAVPPARPETAAAAPAPAAAPGEPVAPDPPAAGSARVALPGWSAFLQQMLQRRPGLAACLLEAWPEPRGDDVLRLLLPRAKRFHWQQVQQQEAVLAREVADAFGRRLELAAADAPEAVPAPQRDSLRRDVAPTRAEQLARARRDDPVLDAVVSALDGEVLPVEEQDAWHRPTAETNPRPEPPAAEE